MLELRGLELVFFLWLWVFDVPYQPKKTMLIAVNVELEFGCKIIVYVDSHREGSIVGNVVLIDVLVSVDHVLSYFFGSD